MLILHHFPLCPFSRQIRVILSELKLDFELKHENYWERSNGLAKLNPAVELPVLIDGDNVICSMYSIIEYIDELYCENSLLGSNANERAETRRLLYWFNSKFYQEVTRYIVDEKIIRHYTNSGYPNSDYIRAANMNILPHLNYIAYLHRKNKWLAGNKMSFVDFAAASQLSVLDYLGDVPWDYNEGAKNWYAIVKSRPSFRTILSDRIVGFNPSPVYMDLDF